MGSLSALSSGGSTPAQAVPGIYLLFVVDQAGVPSVAKRVYLVDKQSCFNLGGWGKPYSGGIGESGPVCYSVIFNVQNLHQEKRLSGKEKE